MHPRLQNSNRLPSLPAVAVEILRLFNLPDVAVHQLTDVIETDPALAMRILEAANSTRYGVHSKITHLRQAVARLGRNNITPLVLSFSLASASIEESGAAEHYRKIWLKSFVQATAAETIAAPYGDHTAAECFTVSLLCGLGHLAQLKADYQLYDECVRRACEESRPRNELEFELFGITGIRLSENIFHDIGLPERCRTAVHLLESDDAPKLSNDDARLASVTQLAHAVARYLCDGDPAIGLFQLKDSIAAHRDSEEASVDKLLEAIHTRLEASASLFNVDAQQIPTPEVLLEAALDQLAQFTTLISSGHSDQVPNDLLEENGRLKRRVQDLLKESSLDALTRIHNRAWFDTNLLEIQAISRVHKTQFGIALIDIDHFKNINDQYGHQAGDHVLQIIAQALSQVTRREETLARYGGEEFALVLEDATAAGMAAVGERLRATAESQIIELGDTVVPVTVSIGIAHGSPTWDDGFARDLFARADAAMYAAKAGGRNRVVVVDSHSEASAGAPSEVSCGDTV